MARIDWIEDRLNNWARWKLTRGTGGLGYASVNLANPTLGVREPYAEAPIPTNAVEAGETDDAVNRLHPPELGQSARRPPAQRLGAAARRRRHRQAAAQLSTRDV